MRLMDRSKLVPWSMGWVWESRIVARCYREREKEEIRTEREKEGKLGKVEFVVISYYTNTHKHIPLESTT